MKTATVERSRISFRGVLRTSRGTMIFVAVENMPIAPKVAPTVATNTAYGHPAELKKRGEGVAASVTVVETLDYYPYGGIRLDNTTSSFSGESRKWLGQYFDNSDSLNYLNARYENPNQGQFISQDPLFLGGTGQQNISNPQSLNAYSYSEDNPISNSDPTGKIDGWDDLAGFLVGGAISTKIYYGESQLTGQPTSLSGAFGAFIGGGVLGVGAVDAPETGGASEVVAGRIAAAILNGEIAGAAGGLASQGAQNVGDLINKKPLPGLSLPGIAGDTLWGGAINGVAGGIAPMENYVSSPAISGGGSFNEAELNSQQQQIHSPSPVSGGVSGGTTASTAFQSAAASQVNSIYQTLTGILGDLTRILTSLQATYTVTPSKSSSSH